MVHALVISALLAASPAGKDVAQARQSYAVASGELEASQSLLRGLDALARSDETWDHQHPAKLFADAQRAVATAEQDVQELSALAAGPLAAAGPALTRARAHLADAKSDLRALAAPALGMAVPAAERSRAVVRLQGSISAAQRDLADAAAGLQVR